MASISIKVTLPKNKFINKKWLDKIASAQRRLTVPAMRKLFNKTVYGWSQKPTMGWSQTKSQDQIGIQIYPTGADADIWILLNSGARAHQIYPKKQRGMLRFRPGYKAATVPGSLQSGRKYRSGKPISVPFVSHPGFEARKFTEVIAQEYASEFGMQMQKAVTEAARQK